MRLTKAILVGVFILALTISHALAGVVLTIRTESLDGSEADGTAVLYVESDRIRIDSSEGGGNYSTIYRVDAQGRAVYWLIDHSAGTYVEITQEEMDELKKQVDEVMAWLGREMEQVPKEKRAEVEKMYREKLGHMGQTGEKTEYKKVASGVKINKWTCSQYEGIRRGEKREEVWAASWKELGMTESDMEAFFGLAELFRGVGQKMPSFYNFGRTNTESENAVEGFPVLVVSYEGGAKKEKSELKDVREEKFKADIFNLPDGLKKQLAPVQSPR